MEGKNGNDTCIRTMEDVDYVWSVTFSLQMLSFYDPNFW